MQSYCYPFCVLLSLMVLSVMIFLLRWQRLVMGGPNANCARCISVALQLTSIVLHVFLLLSALVLQCYKGVIISQSHILTVN